MGFSEVIQPEEMTNAWYLKQNIQEHAAAANLPSTFYFADEERLHYYSKIDFSDPDKLYDWMYEPHPLLAFIGENSTNYAALLMRFWMSRRFLQVPSPLRFYFADAHHAATKYTQVAQFGRDLDSNYDNIIEASTFLVLDAVDCADKADVATLLHILRARIKTGYFTVLTFGHNAFNPEVAELLKKYAKVVETP